MPTDPASAAGQAPTEEEIDLVEQVLNLHRNEVIATAGGPVLRCNCSGWATDYDNPDDAERQHRRHVADHALRSTRGWPI